MTRAESRPSLQGDVVEPSAYLKFWFDKDGRPCTRVDLTDICEPWLDAFKPMITPLYSRAALDACGGGWRPIAEAPKDGTHILLSDGENVTIGRIVEDDRWFELNSDPTDYWDGELYPKFWAPLPSPPSEQEEG